MSRVGWKQLNEMLLDPDNLGLIRMPENVTSFALAKACWMEETRRARNPWKAPSLTLYGAMREMILFIQHAFVGGVEWSRDSGVSVMPESPGYYLYAILDEGGRFSMSSRMLMDFVIRGEAKMIYRRHSRVKAEQLEIKGGFDEKDPEG